MISVRKQLVLIIVLFFLIAFNIIGVNAQLSCSVKDTCAESETAIFKISAEENAHAEIPSGVSYGYKICCSQPSYTLTASSTSASCSEGYTEVIRLSADTNAHLQRTDYITTAYPTKVCLSSPSGVPVSCRYTSSCSSDETCLASISDSTNAHAGDCNSYSTKICCKLECADEETICDNKDNDCDDLIDEGCDDDDDGYCDSGMTIPDGVTPSTCTSGGGDCNDGNSDINPGKAENCANAIDDNCNSKTDCTDTACAEQQGPTADGWFGGGNNPAQATCGTADNDPSSEYRDYYCTGTSDGEIHKVTSTKDCDSLDGWFGGGNDGGCGTDPSSVWNDYYVIASTGTCASTTSCTGTGTFNCDSSDICNNKCEGTVFISVPLDSTIDYYVVTDTKTCASTQGAYVEEDCATKPSEDSDGSSTAYTTGGTVNDYTACTLTGCSFSTYNDACSVNTLTEYGASAATYTSGTKNCEDYETNYCSSDRYYRQEWGCSGTPGYCNDGAVADTTSGTNSDGDAKDKECGDSLCDNAAGVYDSTKTSTETNCADGLDNDCDGTTDCADSDCAAKTGPDGARCCQSVSDCVQDDCVIESCSSNKCSYTDRAAGAVDECSTCQACDTAGGNCVGISAESGKGCTSDCYDCVSGACTSMTENDDGGCADDCTYCSSGTCTNRPAGATDECGTCQACDKAGGNCLGISAETGKNCIADCYDCVFGACTAMTESNDGACTDDCTKCSSGACINRNACDSAECAADKYCDAAGGDCKTPDESQNVCLNCVADQTSGYSWTSTSHEDAGKAYSTELFNSNGPSACPTTSCTKPPSQTDCHCYDPNNNAVNHKTALSSGNCCGDDSNEYYKPDYYGPECANEINDCVWSTGDAQASNTGNAQWWCYLHEWSECIDSAIGTKTGESGTNGVTCAGIVGDNAWTPNSLVKPEDQYSSAQINACTDGLDNDGDGLKDCEDPDCGGSITGTVKDSETTTTLAGVSISAKKGLVTQSETTTDSNGEYAISPINCGSYNLGASKAGYIPQTRSISLAPKENKAESFNLVSGSDCNDDCTRGKPVSDGIVHAECDGLKGCSFCDATAKAKCDKSQPGWVRDYDAEHYVVCAEGCPQLKVEIKASVDCPSGTLVKVTRIAMYNGKPVKLVVATCG